MSTCDRLGGSVTLPVRRRSDDAGVVHDRRGVSPSACSGLAPACPAYRAYGRRHIARIRQLDGLSRESVVALEVASTVLPFRVNDYVLEELIDWSNVPSDPIYQLTFPQAGMLAPSDFARIRDLVVGRASEAAIRSCAREIQLRMNPHPDGQMDLNVPSIDGRKLRGCQHKYRETVLYFPPAGQTCHAFCTYCFRWPQFSGIERLKFAQRDVDLLIRYLRQHTEVSDVLVTGGDPLFMSGPLLRRTIAVLLADELEHITTIRIGTKALSYWPYRFTTDRDADEVLRTFEDVQRSGRQLALMAHVSHPRELQTEAARRALARVRGAGAVVRCQSPLARHINDDPETWAQMWQEQVRLGTVPYYLFVARSTGPNPYFGVSLVQALRIFSEALSRVSGLARTVRGPVISAAPGKVLVVGTDFVGSRRVLVLKMIQGRRPEWTNRLFFARFDPYATSLEQLEPAFNEREFFYEDDLRQLAEHARDADWEQGSETVN